jgi:hypothetical protein
MSDQVKTARSVERIITGQAVMDGAGVKINRVLTQTLQRRLDPFLMLDNFGSDQANDYIAGFPSHPHRGFETVTYMIEGRMRHKDSAGNEGLLTNGGVQWMTAGRGVIHSEMPEQEDGVMEGFQLWLNLPAKDKMRARGIAISTAPTCRCSPPNRAPGESDRRPQPWRGRRRAARGDRAAVSGRTSAGRRQLRAGAAGRPQRLHLHLSRCGECGWQGGGDGPHGDPGQHQGADGVTPARTKPAASS